MDVRPHVGRVPSTGGGVLTDRVAVDAAELLRLAQCVDDELDLDGVSAALRGIARDPDADIAEAVRRVRLQSQGCPHCTGRHRCPYHEGWSDALDLLEGDL